MSYFWPRMNTILEYISTFREQGFNQSALSLALYEEIDIMCGFISQLMEYPDEFAL